MSDYEKVSVTLLRPKEKPDDCPSPTKKSTGKFVISLEGLSSREKDLLYHILVRKQHIIVCGRQVSISGPLT